MILRKPRGLFAKRLGLTGIQDIDSVLDLISPVDFRSDGLGTKEVMGGGADDGWRRRAAASSPPLAETVTQGSISTRVWVRSGLGPRGTRLGDRLVEWEAGQGLATARGGAAMTTGDCRGKETQDRGNRGGMASLTLRRSSDYARASR